MCGLMRRLPPSHEIEPGRATVLDRAGVGWVDRFRFFETMKHQALSEQQRHVATEGAMPIHDPDAREIDLMGTALKLGKRRRVTTAAQTPLQKARYS